MPMANAPSSPRWSPDTISLPSRRRTSALRRRKCASRRSRRGNSSRTGSKSPLHISSGRKHDVTWVKVTERVPATPFGVDYAADVAAVSGYWRTNPDKQSAREARFAFLRAHARTLYDKLTDNGADVCILDPDSQVAVLRGDVVPEGKYAGRRVYNAGINLTHLYYGKIPFLWFLIRDLGFVNKMFRGLARPDVPPDEVAGDSIEKLWISAVETFAIGRGSHIPLACPFNLAPP